MFLIDSGRESILKVGREHGDRGVIPALCGEMDRREGGEEVGNKRCGLHRGAAEVLGALVKKIDFFHSLTPKYGQNYRLCLTVFSNLS